MMCDKSGKLVEDNKPISTSQWLNTLYIYFLLISQHNVAWGGMGLVYSMKSFGYSVLSTRGHYLLGPRVLYSLHLTRR